MSTPFPPPKARGIDHSLPTCGETLCHGRGTCTFVRGGSGEYACDCNLGYRGQFCEGTVNGELSLPLTLSVLAVIIGLLILAVVIAKVRQKQKNSRRKHLAEKHGYNISV